MSEKPKSLTIHSRVSAYSHEGMYVFDSKKKIMMCRICNTRVNWERKSVVDLHCNSSNHKEQKQKQQTEDASKKKQISVLDSFDKAEKLKHDREKFIKSTVNAFLKANIPLHKLDCPNMRNWIKEYIPGGGDLPNSKYLREHYVPLIKKDYDENLKEYLKNKKLVVLCDETTNKKGEAAFLVLFKVLPTKNSIDPHLVVAGVKILTAVNGDETSKALLQVLQEFGVHHENVTALVSDGARYMNTCVSLLRKITMPNLIHIQCHAHKLDKVAKVFSDKLVRLNECVAKTKKLFKNTRKRKHNYLKYLKDTYSSSKTKEAKLFPLPVMTRWGSWTKSVIYIREYVEDIAEYAKTIPSSQIVKSVEYFKKLSKEDIDIIKAEATFVEEYCTSVSNLLVNFETSKKPMCHLLYREINDIQKIFSVVKLASNIDTVLYKNTKSSFTALTSVKKKNLQERIRSVCNKCDTLFTDYLKNDPAKKLFKAVQTLFDPCKIVMDCYSEAKIDEAKSNVPLLSSISSANFKMLYGLLVDSVKEIGKSKLKEQGDPTWDALMAMRITHFDFATVCAQVLHIPISNVDCERGFSSYGDILTAKRNRLLPQNTEVMMCIYFGDGDDVNNNESTC